MRFFALLALAGCVHFQEGPVDYGKPAAEFANLRGRRVHFVDRGKGPRTVVLVHGYGASKASFEELIDRLAPELRVIALDLPGFGFSDRYPGDYSPEALADDLAALLDARGVQRASVLGHSWGASIALAFALRHPDRLDKLVLMSAWCYTDQLTPFFDWVQVPGLGEMIMTLFYPQRTGDKLALNFAHPEKFVTAERVDKVEENLARPGALATLLAAARGMSHFAELEPQYPKIATDTLLVWGQEDRVALLPFGERLAHELPHARLVVIGDCGHIPEIECPEPTAHAIGDFLK